MAASDERLKDWEGRLAALQQEMEAEYPARPGFYDAPIATLTRYAKEAVEDERRRLGPDNLRHLLDVDEPAADRGEHHG